jgi:hypothetical protein
MYAVGAKRHPQSTQIAQMLLVNLRNLQMIIPQSPDEPTGCR